MKIKGIVRSDDIHTEIYNFKAIHGGCGISYLYTHNFTHIPTVSRDICVVMITNYPYQNYLVEHYLAYPDKINLKYIVLDKPVFVCGRDLIEPLLEYIKHIDEKYVLYMDAGDTALMSDILDPQGMLDSYNCKILFNAEDSYTFPDHCCVPKDHLEAYAKYHNCAEGFYYVPRDKIIVENTQRLQKIMNCYPYTKSLNSGLFLGERMFMIEALTRMVEYMNDDPIKGFPYGEIENQKLWQYVQCTYENGEIQVDYLNIFFLWLHAAKFDFPFDSWEHFNFFNKMQLNEDKMLL
jgi:hypothetical protein